MTYCNFCQKRGHQSADCWYKNKYIKEITKKNGKLVKTYKYDNESTRNKRRSSSPIQTSITISTHHKKSKSKTHNEQKRRQSPILIQQPDIELIKEIRNTPSGPQPPKALSTIPSTSTSTAYNRCKECVKWEIRLQHSLSANIIEKKESNRIIQKLTEETMSLRDEMRKMKEDRDSWKSLYNNKK